MLFQCVACLHLKNDLKTAGATGEESVEIWSVVQVVCGFPLHLLYWLSLHGNLSPASLFEVKALWLLLFEN